MTRVSRSGDHCVGTAQTLSKVTGDLVHYFTIFLILFFFYFILLLLLLLLLLLFYYYYYYYYAVFYAL